MGGVWWLKLSLEKVPLNFLVGRSSCKQVVLHVGATYHSLGGVPGRACPLLCPPASRKQDQDFYCFLNAFLICCFFLSPFPVCLCVLKGVGFPRSEQAGGATAAGADLSGMSYLERT